MAGLLLLFALIIGVAAPILALAGVVEPIEVLDTTALHVVGIALFLVGLAATLAAQIAMGDSRRISPDLTAVRRLTPAPVLPN